MKKSNKQEMEKTDDFLKPRPMWGNQKGDSGMRHGGTSQDYHYLLGIGDVGSTEKISQSWTLNQEKGRQR